MSLQWGPVVFGFALLVLSMHPLVVEGIAWIIPIQEQAERPVFASAGLVVAALAFLAYGCFPHLFRRRRSEPQTAETPSP